MGWQTGSAPIDDPSIGCQIVDCMGVGDFWGWDCVEAYSAREHIGSPIVQHAPNASLH